MNTFIGFLLSIPGMLFATTMHEFTRAAVSTACGDQLPKNKGRLTLNPFKHFEPIGFLLLFYSGGFGWGKPVETSGLYYKNRKRDTLLTAILPSVVNLVFGLIFITLSGGLRGSIGLYGTHLLHYLGFYNIGIAVYNLLPVSPMDCVKVLSVILPANQYFRYMQNEKLIQMLFLLLLFFGLVTGIFNVVISGIIYFFQSMIF